MTEKAYGPLQCVLTARCRMFADIDEAWQVHGEALNSLLSVPSMELSGLWTEADAEASLASTAMSPAEAGPPLHRVPIGSDCTLSLCLLLCQSDISGPRGFCAQHACFSISVDL